MKERAENVPDRKQLPKKRKTLILIVCGFKKITVLLRNLETVDKEGWFYTEGESWIKSAKRACTKIQNSINICKNYFSSFFSDIGHEFEFSSILKLSLKASRSLRFEAKDFPLISTAKRGMTKKFDFYSRKSY